MPADPAGRGPMPTICWRCSQARVESNSVAARGVGEAAAAAGCCALAASAAPIGAAESGLEADHNQNPTAAAEPAAITPVSRRVVFDMSGGCLAFASQAGQAGRVGRQLAARLACVDLPWP